MIRAPMKVIYDPPLHTILVAGGAGFAGAALCGLLARDGALRVISVDRAAEGNIPRETGNFRAVAADVADRAMMDALLTGEQVDSVVDLVDDHPSVAEAAETYWQSLPHDGRDCFRLVSVTADARRVPKVRPTGLKVVRAVTAAVYGPGQPEDAVIPSTILAALAGAPVQVENAGLATTDWLHVDDHGHALVTLLQRGQAGAVYQIGARETRSTLATVAMICDLVDRIAPRADGRKHRSLIRFGGNPTPVERRLTMDPARIENELGWHAQIDFREGLLDTIDWYRTQVQDKLRTRSHIG